MTKTTFASEADHQAAMSKWYIVDASKLVLGRMAVGLAEILMGKHSPLYTPHLSVGHGIIVINAAKVGVTGNKKETKVYRRYSGYPGGLKETSYTKLKQKDSPAIFIHAVKGMLPKNRLGRKIIEKLHVYPDTNHKHQAQQPESLKLFD